MQRPYALLWCESSHFSSDIKINIISELPTEHTYWKDVGKQMEIFKNKNNGYEEEKQKIKELYLLRCPMDSRWRC